MYYLPSDYQHFNWAKVHRRNKSLIVEHQTSASKMQMESRWRGREKCKSHLRAGRGCALVLAFSSPEGLGRNLLGGSQATTDNR